MLLRHFLNREVDPLHQCFSGEEFLKARDFFSLPSQKDKNCIQKGPFMALDWGKKQCGLAISDPSTQWALPLQNVRSGCHLRWHLVEFWKAYNVQLLIVGWPLDKYGQPNPICHNILRLVYRLWHQHAWPIVLWDEYLTTSEAREKQDISIPSRKKRKLLKESESFSSFSCQERVDARAASLILQGAIDQWKLI